MNKEEWKKQYNESQKVLKETTFYPEYDYVRVYVQINHNLINVTDSVSVGDAPFTLEQCYQIGTMLYGKNMIYVIKDGDLEGTIYRCGNSKKGHWQVYAKTIGYA